MRIGYPCINLSIGCKSGKTFRLRSYSEQRLIETVDNNLDCLLKILRFNYEHNILFFRITSDLVPFASHPICRFDWQSYFKDKFEEIGEFIKRANMRVTMHPDQFTLINSIDEDIFYRSVQELAYHAQVLDLMKLDTTAKIQIHVGGVYGDKEKSMKRFVERFFQLDDFIARRLVIENDDKLYSLQDCLKISRETGLPVVLDIFHHRLKNSGENITQAFREFSKTWSIDRDGVPIVDYSIQKRKGSPRQHAESINMKAFKLFLEETKPYDFDIMLEIKDKERSALKAIKIASTDPRFLKVSRI
ncbi:MAG: UV DNA damage repair endonuclease UvsE [Nitrososphaerota archaeon]|nr:UV DNA damage repair endonuclease UvsE [Nitrososphaerota archaeon]